MYPRSPGLPQKKIGKVSKVSRRESHKGPPVIRISDRAEGWGPGSTKACGKKVKGGVITDRYSFSTVSGMSSHRQVYLDLQPKTLVREKRQSGS